MQTSTADQIRATVRQAYGAVAQREAAGRLLRWRRGDELLRPHGTSSTRLGYSDADVADVPDGADLGLGCGNPQAIAALTPGERVLDLGSGGGFDAFLAARQVGPTGRVIGVDMTPEMIALAHCCDGHVGPVVLCAARHRRSPSEALRRAKQQKQRGRAPVPSRIASLLRSRPTVVGDWR